MNITYGLTSNMFKDTPTYLQMLKQARPTNPNNQGEGERGRRRERGRERDGGDIRVKFIRLLG